MKDGGPAFPHIHGLPVSAEEALSIEKREVVYHGLTMRDYFATRAMSFTLPLAADVAEYTSSARIHAARLAYDIADAMLVTREERPKPPLEVTEEHREQGATDLQRAYPERRP